MTIQGIDPFMDIFVVHSEHDTPDKMRSRGGIIAETYTGHANLVNAVEHGKKMKRYGQITICRVVPIGTLEECEEYINRPGTVNISMEEI